MDPLRGEPAPQPDDLRPTDWPANPAIQLHEPRNLVLLALHQIVFRIAWMFKTESVIIPAFLDYVSGPGAGGLRGCLPVLNRLGQSVLPVWFAGPLERSRHKKLALSGITALMALPWAAVAAVQYRLANPSWAWMPWLFLAMYFVFSALNGVYQLSFGTVQGKLIRPTRRGYLLSLSTSWGTIPAVAVALWLMPGWLRAPVPNFAAVFAAASVGFLLASSVAACLFETGDQAGAWAGPPTAPWRVVIQVFRSDPRLRRLTLVAVLFSFALMLFPHYQAMARERLSLAGAHQVLWVVTQSASVGVYSLFVGPLADARGNRLTLRLLIFGSAIAPAFAWLLLFLPLAKATSLFWLTFVPLGLTPLVTPMIVNYALEMCEPADHPRYLSTVNLSMTLPFVLSPIVGKLIDVLGFEAVFLLAVCLIVLGGWLTFGLEEPRYRPDLEKPRAVGPAPHE